MREYIIDSVNSGQRLDKYVFKLLPKANTSLIYKMLRKKNIVLNGKKSDGKDIINDGDIIKIFMSDETIDKFSGNGVLVEGDKACDRHYEMMPEVVFEDENMIVVNKPAGMLSQKAKDSDVSLNEICISYLQHNHDKCLENNNTFKPSICNRLDRNTSGLMIFAKNYQAARNLTEVIRNRDIKKYYYCLVKGKVDKDILLKGLLIKDEQTNKVTVNKAEDDDCNIATEIEAVTYSDKISLLRIHLITGKTHQIRAHLSSIGHPIIGDYKYGDSKINDHYKKKFGITSQMLCSYKLVMPSFEGALSQISNLVLEIDMPKEFVKVIKDGNLEI